MIPPHGGTLVDRTVSGRKQETLLQEAAELPALSIIQPLVKDLQNIADGRYSPLTGFMHRNDFLKVVADNTLEDGTPWTVPIILDIPEETADALDPGDRATLQTEDGTPLAVLDVDETYRFDKEAAAEQLYGTSDVDHPGVAMYHDKHDYAIGGDITLIQPGFTAFQDYNLSPAETRVLFKEKNWNSVVGFQTRNAPHRGHEYLQKSALEHVDAILIHPKIGVKKTGDYRDQVILDAYRTLLQNYYRDQAAMSIFGAKMRYMGPREAVFDAVVRKNHGCTHFIVGRDHAGVGDYYDEFAAQDIFDEFGDIGIQPLFYDYAFFCQQCEDTVSEKICPHDQEDRVTPSGTKIRSMLSNGETPPREMMRPEVAQTITQFDQPLVT